MSKTMNSVRNHTNTMTFNIIAMVKSISKVMIRSMKMVRVCMAEKTIS